MMSKIIVICFLAMMVSGCFMSKKVAVCLEYHEGGHGLLKFGAGVWSGGDVLEVSMNGPATYTQVPVKSTIHPCPHNGTMDEEGP